MWLLIYTRRKITASGMENVVVPSVWKSFQAFRKSVSNKIIGEITIKDHIQHFFHTSSDPGLLTRKLNALSKRWSKERKNDLVPWCLIFAQLQYVTCILQYQLDLWNNEVLDPVLRSGGTARNYDKIGYRAWQFLWLIQDLSSIRVKSYLIFMTLRLFPKKVFCDHQSICPGGKPRWWKVFPQRCLEKWFFISFHFLAIGYLLKIFSISFL